MNLDKTHGNEATYDEFSVLRKNNDFNSLLIQELESWIKSMYLLPEEFDFQKKKIYRKVKEKVLEESGW